MKEKDNYKWIPVVIKEFCTGCGLCVEACGPACLETQNLVAVLERPNDCGSEEHCISACPEDAIYMTWIPIEGDRSIGRWGSPESTKTEPGSRRDAIHA